MATRATTAGRTRAQRGGGGRRAPVQVRVGRLVLLALVLIAAALYVAPLRAFFAQQDRYGNEVASLQAARKQNAYLKKQAELLSTERYVAQVARSDSLLVPPDTQAFVVKGLPGKDDTRPVTLPAQQAATGTISVLERIEDLWRTVLD
jgi:hypothetical protein